MLPCCQDGWLETNPDLAGGKRRTIMMDRGRGEYNSERTGNRCVSARFRSYTQNTELVSLRLSLPLERAQLTAATQLPQGQQKKIKWSRGWGNGRSSVHNNKLFLLTTFTSAQTMLLFPFSIGPSLSWLWCSCLSLARDDEKRRFRGGKPRFLENRYEVIETSFYLAVRSDHAIKKEKITS